MSYKFFKSISHVIALLFTAMFLPLLHAVIELSCAKKDELIDE